MFDIRPALLKIESADSGETEGYEMTELTCNKHSLALFRDAGNPRDAIQGALALLSVLRENFATENEDYPTWLQLGVVADTVAAAVERMK